MKKYFLILMTYILMCSTQNEYKVDDAEAVKKRRELKVEKLSKIFPLQFSGENIQCYDPQIVWERRKIDGFRPKNQFYVITNIGPKKDVIARHTVCKIDREEEEYFHLVVSDYHEKIMDRKEIIYKYRLEFNNGKYDQLRFGKCALIFYAGLFSIPYQEPYKWTKRRVEVANKMHYRLADILEQSGYCE